MTLQEYVDSLKGRRVGVIGIGISNTPLLGLLLDSGVDVTACDKRSAGDIGEAAVSFAARGAKLRLGPDYLRDLDFDIIFRTPGLLPNVPELAAAREKGTVITSEMEAFFRLCPCRTIAVTGSDGKTTTSSIIAELLRAGGKTVHLGGNIGHPLLLETPKMNPDDVAVLELSSFQLHSIDICPDTAVITNISPNHLDVHPDFEDYVAAKRRIFQNQTPDCKLILNRDNAYTTQFAEEAAADVHWFSRTETVKNGVFCRDDMIYLSRNYEVESIIPASEILLPGTHNVENYMAAFAAVEGAVSTERCRNVARNYTGVAHRLELVRRVDGVSFINDSIATSPTRTIAGLLAMKKKPILIAGGHDKNIDFDKLADVIAERVRALVLTGDTAEKISVAVRHSVFYDPVRLPVVVADSFREAVLAARGLATEGDTVLLSPACSSFDHFKNFAERGDTFRKIVMEFEDKDEIQ